jgi:hypothetical protein
MGIRIASWIVVGITLGLLSAWGTLALNPSVRGEQGAILLAWFFVAQLALVSMVAVVHEGVRRALRAGAVGAGPSLVEVALGALALALLMAATGLIGSGGLRWGLRLLLGPAMLAAAIRLAARTPPVPTRQVVAALASVPAIALLIGIFVLQPGLEGTAAAPAGASLPAADGQPVLLIGVDGADWNRMEGLFAEGRLPTLKRLRDEGTTADLETMQPTWSPRIWNTVSTGRLPDDHGVLDFTELRGVGWDCGIQRLQKDPLLPGSLALKHVVSLLVRSERLLAMPVTSCQRQVPALWNVVSDAGGRAAAIGWFASWPSDPIDGYVVSDLNPFRVAFSARRGIEVPTIAGLTHPPELLADLLGSAAVSDVEDEPGAIAALPFFQDLSDSERAAIRPIDLSVVRSFYLSDGFSVGAAEELLRRERLDLVAIYLSGIDNASHRFARTPSVVDRYYDAMDVFVERLLAAAGPDTVTILVSDHGWVYPPDEPIGHFHAPHGVLLIHGQGVPARQLERTPHVMDIAPTALAFLGLPRGDQMRGGAIAETLPETARASSRRPPAALGSYRYTPGSGEGAGERLLQGDMMERLKVLGYVDE